MLMKICAKCSDMFSADFYKEGKRIKEYQGYVPGFMPGIHYGDYVILQIEIETGQIINWNKPTLEQIMELPDID